MEEIKKLMIEYQRGKVAARMITFTMGALVGVLSFVAGCFFNG